MFKKVLIAEDFDSINIAVIQALEELNVIEIQHAKYCDEALLKIKKAIQGEQPFDLLISDLSFKIDHRIEIINSGEELIANVKRLQPSIKVITYSVEDKSYRIKSLFEHQKINGFVHKGRNSIEQLKIAIQKVYEEKQYISPNLANVLQDKTVHEIDKYDVQIIQFLSKGMQQDEIEIQFKALGIVPSSKSAIEKRISKLKDYFKASNNVHLIAIAKDLGIT